MELIERAGFLDLLQTISEKVSEAEGHCVFINGEAGIGKTSLVKAFCNQQKDDFRIYRGACDALFTPRPLAPLYDILWQVNSNLWPDSHSMEDRTELFALFVRELSKKKEKIILVFEDVHWADEATLDFIKFFARRITQLRCLFLLTYRDDEISTGHALRHVLGQLPPDSFTRLQLTPLSREAVEKLSMDKGYSGEDVYSISGGNPFYVNEILASYNKGIPENIKDAVLSVYNRQEEKTKQVWELLSVIPSSFEVKYLEQVEPVYATAIERCLEAKILLINNGLISFKHELFRRAIESFLSPLKRVSLNKKILDLLWETFEKNHEIERIIHHAKNANDYEMVIRYAPLAARHAASVGAHTEAAKLYLSAIEYYPGNDKDLLVQFYDGYAYECYLTNQIKEAIIYATKSLSFLKEKNQLEKMADCMRFLSRLWWLDGNRKHAENFANQAVDALAGRTSSAAKAMSFSNMSQLQMLLDQPAECIAWGEQAIAIAKEANDDETLSHALNNVGAVQMNIPASRQKGTELLLQSLAIALKNAYHEHAARAYSNLGSTAVKLKDYSFAKKILTEGIQYCEERDLDSWRSNMLSVKATLYLETGDWKKAEATASVLLESKNQLPSFMIATLTVLATIKMRQGDSTALPLLLDAGKRAFETMELQRIIPSLVALLEYEWLTGKTYLEKRHLEHAKNVVNQSIYYTSDNEFAFWLYKARNEKLPVREANEGYDVRSIQKAQKAATFWEKKDCPYEQALALFEGTDDNKRQAISIVHSLGATAVYEKMKSVMRISGIKSIPRGMRKTTQSNPALLTSRELDVLQLLQEGMHNKEIAAKLYISAKTVDHHISSILFKLDVNSRIKAVNAALQLAILK